MYGNLLTSDGDLGGETILTTTLLQVNGKLELINHITERLEEPEHLMLYTLSSLNMETHNKRDPNNFCTLLKQGDLSITDVTLGV